MLCPAVSSRSPLSLYEVSPRVWLRNVYGLGCGPSSLDLAKEAIWYRVLLAATRKHHVSKLARQGRGLPLAITEASEDL